MYNETYDEYIRSILGYPPMRSYENDFQDYRSQNMDYNMTSNMNTNSINNISDTNLESCYPEIYKIVYPMVTKKCSNVRMPVTDEDIQNMTDEIYFALEGRTEVQININLGNDVRNTETTNTNTTRTSDKKPEVKVTEVSGEKRETRQINRGLRDLIQILLIRELLNRPGRPPIQHPPMTRPRPPVRPPFRPGDRRFPFSREFEASNYDIFEY
ncbi:MAG: hypothetical protein IJE05_07405 [Clostridia bacterium]|nr:hypothetical protein [Clostridia bacterium]